MGGDYRVIQVVLLLIVLSGCISMELEIMPISPVQSKPVGKKVLLTCRAQDDKGLTTSLTWLDPNNRTITNDDPNMRDRLSVERMSPDTVALIFTSLKESEAGTYTCSAVYAGTQTISKSVRINTIYAIRWIDAPEEQFPILGSNYKVKCQVQANPAPIVDWLRNGQQIVSNGKQDDHLLITTDGLIINNVTEADDGTYVCRAIVLDTGELDERNIKVEVLTAPSFDETMLSTVEAVEGEQATVTCIARGKPKPQYSWIRTSNHLNLASSDHTTVNENTGVLTFTRVSKEDNGELKCMVKNGAGSKEKAVNFVVLIKPQVMDIRNISIPEGKEARLVCRASGNPLPKVTFRKIGAGSDMVSGTQPGDERVVVDQRMVEDLTEATLLISPLKKSDDGLYTCYAENKGGKAMKNGHLTVEYKPTFENTPINKAWSWNKIPVNLTCLAESIPNATISWRLNERDIDKDPNFKKFGGGPGSTLLVTPTEDRFYGTYKCVARNLLGENFHEITLQKAERPSEVLQVLFDTVTATTITFSFQGPRNNGGRPIKAYQVMYKEQDKKWTAARNKTWAVSSPYILEGLTPQTRYDFKFAAMNDVGIGEWGAFNSVLMRKISFPEEPKILNPTLSEEKYAVSPYHNRYELSWRIPADNGEPINKYDIKYCPVQKVNNEWQETDGACRTLEHRSLEVTSLDLTGLQPDSYYKVEIRAHNIIGFSVPGQVVVKTARGSDPPGSFTHEPHLTSSEIITIVVAVLLVILVIVDVSCFFVNDTGLLYLICGKERRNTNEEDAKLGSEGKDLLNNGHKDMRVQIESVPMLDKNKKDTTVEFDMKKATSKTGFVGKDSAV